MLLSSYLYSLLDFYHYSQVNNKFNRVRNLKLEEIIMSLLELNVPSKNSNAGMKGEVVDYLLKPSP